ncbi:MAG: hypothetical protein ACOX0W_02210 [Sphaerochaetaceae bacterium]
MANSNSHQVTVHHWSVQTGKNLAFQYDPEAVGNHFVVFYKNRRVLNTGWVGTEESFYSFNNKTYLKDFKRVPSGIENNSHSISIEASYPYVTVWVLESPVGSPTTGWKYKIIQ